MQWTAAGARGASGRRALFPAAEERAYAHVAVIRRRRPTTAATAPAPIDSLTTATATTAQVLSHIR